MTIIGIDLGASAVKLALLEGRLGRYQLSGFLRAEVPQDGTEIPGLDTRLTVLAELLNKVADGWSAIHGVAFPVDHTSLRCIRLPFKERAQVSRTLPFELESLLPFDLEDMVIDYRHLPTEDDTSQVLAAVAPRERVARLLAELTDLGIEVRALPLDLDLLGGYTEEGVKAVIDLGHSRTLAALSIDGRVVTGRAISKGGMELTRALCIPEQRDWEAATRLKHQLHLDSESNEARVEWEDENTAASVSSAATEANGEDPAEIVRQALHPLVRELRTTLIQFEDAHGVDISEILLTGGGASLGGIHDLLANVMGVRVRDLEIPDTEREDTPGRLAICRALAERGHQASLPGQLLNLRRGEFGFTGNFARASGIIGLVAAAAVVFFLGSLVLHFKEMGELDAELARVDQEISDTVLNTFPDVPADRTANLAQAEAIVAERVTALTQRSEQLGGLVPDEPPMLGLLRDISNGVPAHQEVALDVTDLNVVPGSFTLKTITESYGNLEQIETSLREVFSQVTRSQEQRVSAGIKGTLTSPIGNAESETDE